MSTKQADTKTTTTRVRRALTGTRHAEKPAVPRRSRVQSVWGSMLTAFFMLVTLWVARLYLSDWWALVAAVGLVLVVGLGLSLLMMLFPSRRRDSKHRDLKRWQSVLSYLGCALVILALVALWGRVESWYTPDPPFAPTGLALAAGDESLDVSWDASPAKDTFEFGYELRWKRSVQSWKDANKKTLSDSTTSYRITGLTNNTAYDVTIEAHNLGGTSREVTATATPAAAP